ncbi:hypothetical protein QIS99_25550 [Streptomyces sp. B-S-A8]|uniref:Transcription factor zinc-finger domain-containing protein n=1 Tax=Streptomyces solicavernae TaxID=3043614 RepID=A0ABT6S0X7_9ACTN|nr:hypothetical protein [Streptomyces sp. B-S-A8]MDI3389531.1 hypothetical protein [Streptomyces sp. B-S-A8]
MADPKRWRHTGHRDAVRTALWLLARVEHQPGPCAPITPAHARRIETVGPGAADRVERALDIASQRRTIERPCPCGGAIDVHGGEGRTPVAHCTGCGHIWTEGGLLGAA